MIIGRRVHSRTAGGCDSRSVEIGGLHQYERSPRWLLTAAVILPPLTICECTVTTCLPQIHTGLMAQRPLGSAGDYTR
jgi:hypothetical protein